MQLFRLFERSRNRPRHAGFTLIELMIVVLILGVLSTVAIPNLIKLSHKSKRSEAQLSLKAIHQAQTEYLSQNGQYADTFDDLGVILPGSTQTDPRTLVGQHYTYTVAALDSGNNFRAVAAGEIDGDAVLDVLVIENQLTVN